MALQLAKSRDIVIINADSAQVYADLPVLSAQPTLDERNDVPHTLYGYLKGESACSSARWANDAKKEITAAHQAGAIPVVVGGTGLYLRTLLQGIAPIPEIDPIVRANVRSMDLADAFAALHANDPQIAETLEPTDRSRICRALEVLESTGRSIAAWRMEISGGIANEVDLHPLLLLPPRDWLYKRCDDRFDAMIASGAVEEVASLIYRGLPQDAPVMRAIGVPQISAMLAGALSLEEAVARGKIATRQYAKRQFTWFKNQCPAAWPRWNEEINDSNLHKIETLLQL